MKASIFYSMLFVTAITLIATADYSDADMQQKKDTVLTLRSAAVQDVPSLYPTAYTVTTDSAHTHLR